MALKTRIEIGYVNISLAIEKKNNQKILFRENLCSSISHVTHPQLFRDPDKQQNNLIPKKERKLFQFFLCDHSPNKTECCADRRKITELIE